jgi:uncharacterized Fe-S cluster protein YjdI
MGARLQVYETDAITVSFDPGRCIHSAECVRGLPAVFDPRRKRWIQPEHASAEAVAEVVARCPTGALQVRRPDGSAAQPAPAAAPSTVTVTASANGPLFVRGPVRVLDAAGNLLREDDRVALCRCGATANPPFCDGSHARVGFRPGG